MSQTPAANPDAALPEEPVESDAPRTTFIFAFALASCIGLGLVLLGIDQMFNVLMREEVAEKVLRPESSALRALRADEQAKLTHYQWVDQKKGVLRVPLERAMELTLAEWAARPQGFVAGTPDPAAAPAAPAPAPERKP